MVFGPRANTRVADMQSAHAETLHREFIELVEAYYRDAGWDMPSVQSDPEKAVAFKADVEGIAMTVGYDPRAGECCLFVYCVLGVIHDSVEPVRLRRLLEMNLPKLRDVGAAFCIDSDTSELVSYLRSSPRIELEALHSAMAALASYARAWLFPDTAGQDEAADGSADAGRFRQSWVQLA